MAFLVTILLLVGVVLLVVGLAPRDPRRPRSYGFPVITRPVLPLSLI